MCPELSLSWQLINFNKMKIEMGVQFKKLRKTIVGFLARVFAPLDRELA
jgi:hypothetical protein